MAVSVRPYLLFVDYVFVVEWISNW